MHTGRQASQAATVRMCNCRQVPLGRKLRSLRPPRLWTTQPWRTFKPNTICWAVQQFWELLQFSLAKRSDGHHVIAEMNH
mmetsp:Transcript_37524/g.94144  ORF Transcript_37524/g.94144 Transcript_37524/m.94144 type:complete len:80 (+) Transcript_37524:821-1060(+)